MPRLTGIRAGILMATAVFAMAVTARADRDVDETLSVPAEVFVEISNLRGDVDIVGWDRDEVRVRGELDRLAEELVFERVGKRVVIEVKMPSRDVNWGDGSDLEISVPHTARVDFQGVSTDVDVREVKGGLRLRTVSGDLEAREVEGDLIVNSVSGDLELSGTRGDVRIKTVSGEIELEAESENIVLDTVSGEIDVELREFASLRATAISGDMELDGQLAADGLIDINTVNGDLNVDLKDPVDAIISVVTGPGGDIENRVTSEQPTERFPASMELETVSGSGAGRIKLRTVNGDIRIQSDS